MIKSLLLLMVILGGLMVGGVVEIKVHPGEIMKVPSRVVTFATSSQLQEQTRVQVTRLKRWGENAMTQDPNKKAQLAVSNLKADAERLQKLVVENEGDIKELVPQAKLLLSSVEHLRQKVAAASSEAAPQLRIEAAHALAAAQQAFSELEKKQAEQESVRATLKDTIDTFGSVLKELGVTPSPSVQPQPSGVPGPLPKPAPSTPTPTLSPIPLRF